MKQVAGLTGKAFLQILGMVKPGIREYEIMAELGAGFIRSGAAGHAFEPIIASGARALVLHYVHNRGVCREGELLLMDFGAEWLNYAADCSRTVPVSGRFTPRQRQVYEAARNVFLEARSMMVPGRRMKEFHEDVGKVWEEYHIQLGLYSATDARRADPAHPLWKRYYPHGTSHSLGLDVHDPFDRETAFAPGMVLTCEPGIYIKEEGIGIRLENDILIGRDGPVDLMGDLCMEADEIEERMQKKS
jgi:Xaa-Pro aminopeptidase